MEKVVIIGGGGHCASVISAVQDLQGLVGIVDENGKSFLGVPVLGGDAVIDRLAEDGLRYFHVAIGHSETRKAMTERLIKRGLTPASVIDETAVICKTAKIGNGVFIGKRAVVNANAVVEDGCIINTGVVIEHDCRVGPYTHCAPGSVVCGGVEVGTLCFLGANTTVIPGVKIADGVTVGAGSVVISDLSDSGTYVGSPAARIK
jgi:UDP-perosamine 4-acetyltransferase